MNDDPRWLDEKESRAWRGYQALRRDLDSTLERRLSRDSGLSAADYQLLVVLSEAEGQRLRARELRNEVRWDRSRLAHQVRRMEQRGLLLRTECETDARGTMVELTAEGRRAIEEAAPLHLVAVRNYFIDLLTPDELEMLAGIAERVRAKVGDEGCDE